MELSKAKRGVKCRVGGCKKSAKFTVKLAAMGIMSTFHLCEGCLNELYSALGRAVVPKCREMVKKPNEEE